MKAFLIYHCSETRGSRFPSVFALTQQAPKRRRHLGKGAALLRTHQRGGGRAQRKRIKAKREKYEAHRSPRGAAQGLGAGSQRAKVGMSSHQVTPRAQFQD